MVTPDTQSMVSAIRAFYEDRITPKNEAAFNATFDDMAGELQKIMDDFVKATRELQERFAVRFEAIAIGSGNN